MKTITTIIALVALTVLTGCNSDSAPSAPGADTNAPAVQGAADAQMPGAAAPAPSPN